MSKNIQLPSPKIEGEFMTALKERKSYRQFEGKEIPSKHYQTYYGQHMVTIEIIQKELLILSLLLKLSHLSVPHICINIHFLFSLKKPYIDMMLTKMN